MLSPSPKSTVISPGTPRNACITRRWIFSVTGDILEQLSDRLRSVRRVLLQHALEALDDVRGKVIHRFEQGSKEFLFAPPCIESTPRDETTGNGTSGLAARDRDTGLYGRPVPEVRLAEQLALTPCRVRSRRRPGALRGWVDRIAGTTVHCERLSWIVQDAGLTVEKALGAAAAVSLLVGASGSEGDVNLNSYAKSLRYISDQERVFAQLEEMAASGTPENRKTAKGLLRALAGPRN